jgi:hypothetical protein
MPEFAPVTIQILPAMLWFGLVSDICISCFPDPEIYSFARMKDWDEVATVTIIAEALCFWVTSGVLLESERRIRAKGSG